MTVQELIDILNTKDPQMLVVKEGYESGYDDIFIRGEINLLLNTNTQYDYGVHEADENGVTCFLIS